MRTHRAISLTAGVLVAGLWMTGPAVAQEDGGEAEPLWTGNLGLAYVATSGNTDTQTMGLDLGLERRPTPWGLKLGASFNRAEEDGVKTAERSAVSGRATRALSERWELFAGLSGEKDEFAGYDLLFLVESGAAYKALLGPVHSLSFDAGATWTDESRLDPEPDGSYLGAVAGLAYRWKISETASLGERLVFYPNFDDSDDWRLTSETAVTASLSERLALKVGYELRYRNQPIGDNDDTDTTTKISLVLNL